MCNCKTLLIVLKIANGICGGVLLVLGIYVSALIVAPPTSTKPTTTAIIAAVIQVASLVVKVLGYIKCARESDGARKVLSVIKGLLLLVSWSVTVHTGSSSSTFLGDIHLPVVILILPGLVVVTCNALGWFGFLHNCDTLLTLSGILTLILVPLEASGIAIVYKTKLVWSTLEYSLTLYASTSGVKQAWDYVQTNFSCCGVDRASDWITAGISNGLNSCNNSFESRGCFTVFQEILSRNAYIICIVAGIILPIQLCVGVVSIVVARRATKGSQCRCII